MLNLIRFRLFPILLKIVFVRPINLMYCPFDTLMCWYIFSVTIINICCIKAATPEFEVTEYFLDLRRHNLVTFFLVRRFSTLKTNFFFLSNPWISIKLDSSTSIIFWNNHNVNPLSANPTRWSNTLKQFVDSCRRII